ncbi:hypothetical protein RFI_03648 [Reticulomyxa filosa]|uniref:Kinesin light chain n=1 Tax=Reticulomyxa filosa TaxID=46433 RepID=X6P5U6_RETFI|nr:hypothetical protein RFI_03648 [Reticulomyxa filosa]|eukprot:ETO33459.1 hypothetical protein RFI_03648 [Reticulomyxa filosa]
MLLLCIFLQCSYDFFEIFLRHKDFLELGDKELFSSFFVLYILPEYFEINQKCLLKMYINKKMRKRKLSTLKSLDTNLMLISKMVEQKTLIEQIIQVITVYNRHVFLYNKNYSNINIEIDQDLLWNEANKKAHEMVNEMINKKKQGIVVVAKNDNELGKSNEQLSLQNMPFQLTLGQYSIYSKKIIFDNITIDGCIYVVDCIIDAIGNCDITQQLIHTNDSVIRCHLNSSVFTSLLNEFNSNKAIKLFRFVLYVRLQTLHECDKAIEYYNKLLRIRLSELGHDHLDVASAYNNLRSTYGKNFQSEHYFFFIRKWKQINVDEFLNNY